MDGENSPAFRSAITQISGGLIVQSPEELPLSSEKLQSWTDRAHWTAWGRDGEEMEEERKINQKKKPISFTFQEEPGLCKILHSKSGDQQ